MVAIVKVLATGADPRLMDVLAEEVREALDGTHAYHDGYAPYGEEDSTWLLRGDLQIGVDIPATTEMMFKLLGEDVFMEKLLKPLSGDDLNVIGMEVH